MSDMPELQLQPDLEELKKHKLVATNIDHLCLLSDIAEKLRDNGGTVTENDMMNVTRVLNALQITYPTSDKQ